MTVKSGFSVLTMTSLLLSGMMGCVRRKESIVIAKDGNVTIEVQHEGTTEEIKRTEIEAWKADGWEVEFDETVRGDAKTGEEKVEEHKLTAKKSFERGIEQPNRWPTSEEADTDLQLHFPTTLTVEQRGGDTYYRFHRSYLPRRWAYVEYWSHRFLESGEAKSLKDKPFDELTDEEKLHLVRAFLMVEGHKQAELVVDALHECGPEMAIDDRTAVRQALLDVYRREAEHFADPMKQCMGLEEDQRDNCFEDHVRRLQSEGRDAARSVLSGLPDSSSARLAGYERSYQRASDYYHITNSLGGHQFHIEVTLPGAIITHNADKIESLKDGSTMARWEFDGTAFRDRQHELVVVSRIDAAD